MEKRLRGTGISANSGAESSIARLSIGVRSCRLSWGKRKLLGEAFGQAVYLPYDDSIE